MKSLWCVESLTIGEKQEEATEVMTNLFTGEEIPCRGEGQTDKARLNQLKLMKRQLDNEAGDIKEREQKRICNDKLRVRKASNRQHVWRPVM